MTRSTKILCLHLSIMFVLIGYGLIQPKQFTTFLERPEFYLHAKFFHILSVTLFFANTVIGTIWEIRALLTKQPEIIRHTYSTVTWLDGVFTAPLIIIAVMTGIMMGTVLGGVWSIGWLSTAFLLFLSSGAVWIVADLPSQYKIKALFKTVPAGAAALPTELTRLLWRRMAINFLGFAPLLVIFFLMIHKPEIPKLF